MIACRIATAVTLATGLAACVETPPTPAESQALLDEGIPPEACPVPTDEAGILDPGAAGPYGSWFIDYELSNDGFHPQVYLPIEEPVEERGVLFFPDELACGPFPVVVMLHGGHSTCFDDDSGSLGDDWPCPQTAPQAYPSHRGYDYLGLRLASQGFIVASISANGLNALGTGSDDARAELIEHHLRILNQMNTSNAWFGGQLVGRLDLQRVGVLGHSRGGAGAVKYSHLNAAGSPFGLKATFLLAPAIAGDAVAPGVPTATLLPYCDGDHEDLQGIDYFDAGRYLYPGDTAPKYSIEVMGANHNAFNTTWDPGSWPFLGTDDALEFHSDAVCTTGTPAWPRLTSTEQRGALIAYASAFFRVHLKGETSFVPFLTGDAAPPPSAMSQQITQAYHPPDLATHQRAIHRVEDSTADVVNSLGGSVSTEGALAAGVCNPYGGPTRCLAPLDFFPASGRAPHTTSDFFSPWVMRLRWRPGAGEPAWVNAIPVGKSSDFTPYGYVQLRAFVDFQDDRNPLGLSQNFSIELEDGAGQRARVAVAPFTRSLFFPPSAGDPRVVNGTVPHALLNSVRVPLAAFAGQVYLNDIRTVRLVFDQTPSGAIVVSDLLLADPAPNLAPAVACTLADDTLPPSGNLIDVGLEVTVTDPDDAAPATTALAVFSDQDDLQQGAKPDAAIFGDTVQLRGERDPALGGRVYVVVAHASDGAGALGYGCCAATVPQGDPTTADRAAAALDQCTAFMAAAGGGLAPPSGFFAVGE